MWLNLQCISISRYISVSFVSHCLYPVIINACNLCYFEIRHFFHQLIFYCFKIIYVLEDTLQVNISLNVEGRIWSLTETFCQYGSDDKFHNDFPFGFSQNYICLGSLG